MILITTYSSKNDSMAFLSKSNDKVVALKEFLADLNSSEKWAKAVLINDPYTELSGVAVTEMAYNTGNHTKFCNFVEFNQISFGNSILI